MHSLTRTTALLALLACLASARPGLAQPPAIPPYNRDETPGEPPPVPGSEGEVQGRGPIHEGFAQPGGVGRPGPVVPKRPPAPIPESPPDQRPAGDNVAWIPGYWSWDQDRGDFLWVSGLWRVVPAGRTWVPGYWTQADDGWRWVSGMWSLSAQADPQYVPEPPATLDRGPSVPPTEEGSCYVPGTWLYDDSRWLWRPGYYAAPRDGLLYTPSRYVWTPRGYVFASGFWDQPLDARGLLFAPVYFGSDFAPADGWAYQPGVAVDVGGMLGSLWVGPGAGCYAFGDYYAPRYARAGYQSWLGYGPRSYDPLYGYYRHANRHNPSWRGGLVATHNGRLRGTIPAPPATLAGQGRLRDASLRTVSPLSSYRNPSLRMTQVTATDRANAASGARRGTPGRAAPAPILRSPGAGYSIPPARGAFRAPTRAGESPRASAPYAGRPAPSAASRYTPPAQSYPALRAARPTPSVQHAPAPPAARYAPPAQHHAPPQAFRPAPPVQRYAAPPAVRYAPPAQHHAAPPAARPAPAQHHAPPPHARGGAPAPGGGHGHRR